MHTLLYRSYCIILCSQFIESSPNYIIPPGGNNTKALLIPCIAPPLLSPSPSHEDMIFHHPVKNSHLTHFDIEPWISCSQKFGLMCVPCSQPPSLLFLQKHSHLPNTSMFFLTLKQTTSALRWSKDCCSWNLWTNLHFLPQWPWSAKLASDWIFMGDHPHLKYSLRGRTTLAWLLPA